MITHSERQVEKIILVHINLPNTLENSLSEFRELVCSTDGELVDEIIGSRQTISPKYFIGEGKADEIAQAVKYHQADVVIFNHELSPGQEKNLEKRLCCHILDRTALILDIFAKRARSFEGKLQVELAQLQHLSTRLIRGWTHLERQKGGIGLRGPGETQLETDRRLIRVRINAIKRQLEKVRGQRAQGRRSRQRAAIPTVSLVGYTNAGKSSLFNQLTAANVYAADQLFATLDPTLRAIQIDGFGKVIIADTVGFIRDLPHELVAAFHATLEETREASLLLHVIDINDPQRYDKVSQVQQVLKEIGADGRPMLQVLNKIDLMENVQPHLDYNQDGMPTNVWASAEKQHGLDLLLTAIGECLSNSFVHCCLCLKPKQQALRSKLYELHAIIDEHYNEQGDLLLEIRLSQTLYSKLIAANTSFV